MPKNDEIAFTIASAIYESAIAATGLCGAVSYQCR